MFGAPTLAWDLHRAGTELLRYFRPFSSSGRKRVLILSESDEISQGQIFPFFFYAKDIGERYGVEIRELPNDCFLNGKNPYDLAVDAVCFQTWFDLTPSQLLDRIGKIRAIWPNANLAYLDWFAPTDLRYAEALDPFLAVYLKKQIFRDFTKYSEPTFGDTNLTDYYSKRFDLNLPATTFYVPASFQKKVFIGPSFECSPLILKTIKGSKLGRERHIDFHARISVAGTPWYTAMRGEAKAATSNLIALANVAHEGKVTKKKYLEELRSSKICFSPFGYGEVCWRDFEAMSTGAMLIKPDVSHLKLANDIFQPYKTYVPIQWDLSDLADKTLYYLEHRQTREEIAYNAFNSIRDYFDQRKFLSDVGEFWKLLAVHR